MIIANTLFLDLLFTFYPQGAYLLGCYLSRPQPPSFEVGEAGVDCTTLMPFAGKDLVDLRLEPKK